MDTEKNKSTDRFGPAQEEYDSAKEKLERFDRLIENVKSRIESERNESVSDESHLKAAIQEKIAEYNTYQADANLHKDRIDKLKRDISDWKQWYSFSADIDKSNQLKSLDIEVRWRATEIKQLQDKIGALEAQKLDAKIFLMENGQKMQALEKGINALPSEKDPRLLSVMSKRDNAAIEFDAAKKLIEPNC
jgi:predicted  nucleic acid-binding Zn-ribbon protein